MKQFRGISDVYIAEVTEDTEANYTTGTPERLCYAANVGKEVSSDSSTIYLDNKAMQVINSEGSDEITIEGSAIELDVLAKITGKIYDSTLGMYVDSERTQKKFALGYKEKMTDGTFRFNWRLSGNFAIPATSSATEADNTDSAGQSLTYTGVYTEHKFVKANNGPTKGIVVTDALAKTSDWFEEVKTPDTVELKPVVSQ